MALRAAPILIASWAKICRAENLARLRRALLIEQRLGFDLAGRAAGAGTRAKHHDLTRRATRRPAAWRHSVHSTHQSIYLAVFAPRTHRLGPQRNENVSEHENSFYHLLYRAVHGKCLVAVHGIQPFSFIFCGSFFGCSAGSARDTLRQPRRTTRARAPQS